MYAFRFMIGLFESGFSPIIIFLLGSWYNKAELAKRMAIWHITGFFGAATSGFLQAAVHRTLDGRLGLPGWRWMYISKFCVARPTTSCVARHVTWNFAKLNSLRLHVSTSCSVRVVVST
jgi:ACS family pantothenate transporter-like MFS transporter